MSDLGELALGHALPEDHVLGVGGASLTLSGLMLQRPVARALDVGTGCGIQALHASRHADRVVATDISVRALQLAELNAGLNGIDSVEFRLGSLFEPVAGETFDHIVSNPPFVITPRADGVPEYEYRDGGMVGDDLIAAFVAGCGRPPGTGRRRAAARQLGVPRTTATRSTGCAPGSRASTAPLDCLGDRARGGGRAPVRGDLDPRRRHPPGDRVLRPPLRRLAGRLREPLRVRGRLRLRAAAAPRRRRAHAARFERMHGALGSAEAGLGVHLSAGLAAHDWQSALPDDALSAQRLVVSGDVTEERHYWPGDDAPTAMLLRQGGGFGRTVQAGTALVALVGACDGELTVGAIVAALAELLEVDEAALAAELLPAVRALVVDGFLAPAE